ncbi:MAG TPA: thioredoxin family protein [Steroidobacteraceae bacterium]|nr:thioredoxin family protein [Steroidobacteraceae bacterium]
MKRMLGSLALLLALVAAPAFGAEVPYDAAAFQKLLAGGRPVAVDFYASWCPTCRAQAPLLKSLAAEPQFASLTLLVADFDIEKALCKSLNVTEQSTLIVFRNGKEVARSTGDTSRAGLTRLLLAALR